MRDSSADVKRQCGRQEQKSLERNVICPGEMCHLGRKYKKIVALALVREPTGGDFPRTAGGYTSREVFWELELVFTFESNFDIAGASRAAFKTSDVRQRQRRSPAWRCDDIDDRTQQ